jgi:preprotein translocase subunit SecG
VLLYFFYTVHVLICLFLILVVLLQQGSGADLSVFGGGATQTAFGARSATSLLHRLTVAGFVGFILTTIAIGFVKMGGPGSSVMSDVPVAEAPAEAGADEVPALPEATPEGAELVPATDESTPDDEGTEPADDNAPDS